jgi:hypothetical protein
MLFYCSINMCLCLYTQIYFQQTAPYIILNFLCVSATNRSHLQEATVLEDIGSLLCKLSVVNGELFTLFVYIYIVYGLNVA